MRKTKTFAVKSSGMLMAFVLGSLTMVMATMAVAAPTATPTSGDVNANFNSVVTNSLRADYITGVTGSCSTGGCAGNPLTISNIINAPYGIVTSSFIANGATNLNGAISNTGGRVAIADDLDLKGSLINTSTTVNLGKIRLIDDVDILGKLYADDEIFNSGTKNNGTVFVNDDFSVSGLISNISTSNSGRVVINDELAVQGSISNPSSTVNSGNLQINDNVNVSGNITLGGRLNIDGNLQTPDNNFFFEKNLRTQLGKTYGQYIVLSKSISGNVTETGLSSNPSLSMQCPANTQLVSCSGSVFSARSARYEGSYVSKLTADGDTLLQDRLICDTVYRYTGQTGTYGARTQAVCFSSNDVPVVACEAGSYNAGGTTCTVMSTD